MSDWKEESLVNIKDFKKHISRLIEMLKFERVKNLYKNASMSFEPCIVS